jgi:hypothetical protein
MNRPLPRSCSRLPAPLRWRNLRWVLCAATIPALWACNNRKLANPAGAPSQVVQDRILQSQNRKLDLLFMVDDSTSMKPLQQKMANRLPDFMATLKALPGGLPDLHVAVISSSLGAGIFSDVPGCAPGVPGDDGGKFQHKAGCNLNAGSNFIQASQDGSTNNFTGAIEDVFSCIALLGDGGCGFEHQFESTRQALIKSLTPNDPDNGGFFRSDAFLGIVMLTNEDDCSVPPESQLFDPGVMSLTDTAMNGGPELGGLWSYRCNEFGHKCDQPLPHTADGLPMTLTGCQSKENTDGLYHLTPVADFVAFLNQVKTADKLFVAIIAGPTTPYTVHAHTQQLSNGATEMQPEIEHSCMAADGTNADPGVREVQLVSALQGIFLPICADDFKPALTQIAAAIGKKLGVQCITGNVAQVGGAPDCDVVLRTANQPDSSPLPYCDQGTTSSKGNPPCWSLATDPQCPNAQVLKLCYDAACGPPPMTANTTNALVSCALTL